MIGQGRAARTCFELQVQWIAGEWWGAGARFVVCIVGSECFNGWLRNETQQQQQQPPPGMQILGNVMHTHTHTHTIPAASTYVLGTCYI